MIASHATWCERALHIDSPLYFINLSEQVFRTITGAGRVPGSSTLFQLGPTRAWEWIR
jgi:hypothetical protein